MLNICTPQKKLCNTHTPTPSTPYVPPPPLPLPTYPPSIHPLCGCRMSGHGPTGERLAKNKKFERGKRGGHPCPEKKLKIKIGGF